MQPQSATLASLTRALTRRLSVHSALLTVHSIAFSLTHFFTFSLVHSDHCALFIVHCVLNHSEHKFPPLLCAIP